MITSLPLHIHLIGINGSGLRSLADYLAAAGHHLTGTDQNFDADKISYWRQRGVQIASAEQIGELSRQTELLVHSLAVPETDLVRMSARAEEIPDISYPEILGMILKQRRGLGIAGTHGKSTTAAILFHLLQQSGLAPGMIAGGKLVGSDRFGYYGSKDWLVTECCEFRQAFLQSSPERAALLAVEPDHFDCYPDETALLTAFEKFCQQISSTGLLVVNGDSPLAIQAAGKTCARVETFQVRWTGSQESNKSTSVDWTANITSQTTSGMQFILRDRGQLEVGFNFPFYGQHQVGNAVAAILLARSVGLDWSALRRGLSSFPGVERRFQDRGVSFGRRWIDDYAHHPTEIRATLAAARQKFPDRKITALFQPHQIQRTERLLEDFVAALSEADRSVVLPIFAAREHGDERCQSVSQKLVAAGNKRRPVFEYCAGVKQFSRTLDDPARIRDNSSSEVIVVMGAGDIDRIFYELSG